jgi:hypothetical protein
VRAASTDDLKAILEARPSDIELAIEIPLDADEALLRAVADAGATAKLRMGGVTAESIPDPAAVVRSIKAVLDSGATLKLTAGLHHAIRGLYPLSSAEDAPRATMHGFLNVLLTIAVLRDGGTEPEAEALLIDSDRSAFTLSGDGIRWRERSWNEAQLSALRGTVKSFGSCSFTEPVEDLSTLAVA